MNKISIKSLFFVFLLIGTMLPLLFVSAESQTIIQEEEVSVDTIPRNPEPYKEVIINLNSYSTDLDKAVISWQGSNGKNFSGTGKKSISVIAPGPNETLYFDVIISPTGELNVVKKRIFINPSDTDLFWESVDGYTPPFYRGRSLPARGSIIKIVAIPNTNTIKSGIGEIDYTWKNNSKTVQEASGYNKNYYIFKNKTLNKTESVSVLLSSVRGDYGSEKDLNVSFYEPNLLFYKKSPAEGILYNKILDEDFILTEEELTVVAEPYFLSVLNNTNLFSFNWKANDQTIETPEKKTEITIKPSKRSGYAEIGLSIFSTSGLPQKVIGSFNINL